MYHWPSSCQLSNYPHLTPEEQLKEQYPLAEFQLKCFYSFLAEL